MRAAVQCTRNHSAHWPGLCEDAYRAWIDRLVGSKFSYITSVQVYGRCRQAKDLRSRWLAESMDILLETFPKLKVRVRVRVRITASRLTDASGIHCTALGGPSYKCMYIGQWSPPFQKGGCF